MNNRNIHVRENKNGRNLFRRRRISCNVNLMKDLKKSRKRKAPFAWVRNLYKEREERGAYHMLVREMKLGDQEYYFR